MDNNVPYYVYELESAKHERTVKRLVIIIIITIALLFASNMAWLWFFNQFDFESEEVTLNSQDAGNASYMGGSGVIDNGRSEGQNDNNDSQE